MLLLTVIGFLCAAFATCNMVLAAMPQMPGKLQALLLVVGCVLLLVSMVLGLRKSRTEDFHDRASNRLAGVSLVLCLAFALPMTALGFVFTAADPDGYLIDRRWGEENVWEAPTWYGPSWDDSFCIIHDVQYGSDYPNSFFDLYRPYGPVEPRPVFIYIHGGGYYSGDKDFGNPSAMGPGFTRMAWMLVRNGFNLVSVDYALAPEYRYPTPIIQMEQLVRNLQENAEEYGLDMSRVVIGGGSAGGQIAGQFALTQVNADYAAEVGVGRPLDQGQIKVVYLGCALIDPPRFADVDNLQVNYLFRQMQRGYWGQGAQARANIEQASLLANVTADFPPTYIVEGNYATFDEQAWDFAARLEELGVDCGTWIYSRDDDVVVPHGFDAGSRSNEEAHNSAVWLNPFIEEHLG